MDSTQELVEAARKLIAKEETVSEKTMFPARERSLMVESNSLHGSRDLARNFSRPIMHTQRKSGKRAYLFFLATFAIWMVSLLIVYLPISGLMTPTFPFVINNNTMGVFLSATALVVVTSFTLGLNRVRDKG